MADVPADPFEAELAKRSDPFEEELRRRERSGASTAETVVDVGEQSVRGFNKGLATVVTAPYEGARYLLDKGISIPGIGTASPGIKLPPAAEMPLYKPFLQQPDAKTTAGRYASAAGEGIGASVVPSGVILGNAPKLATLAPTTVPRAFGQSLGEMVASNPNAAVAADVVSSMGSGIGQEIGKDAGFGPGGQMLAGVAGGVMPLAAWNTVGKGMNMVRKAHADANPHERIAKGLGDTTVDDLANGVAVGSTTNDLTTSRAVLDILGEEMVRTGGNRPAALKATVDRLEQGGIPRVDAEDQLQRVLRAHADSELMFGEYPAIAKSNMDTRLLQPEHVVDETAGAIQDVGTHRLLDYVANTGSMASSQNVRQAIGNRAQGLRESTEKIVENLAPSQKTIQDIDNLLESAAKQASADYKLVHDPANNLVDNGVLYQGLQGVVAKHTQKMSGRAGEQADALKAALNEFYVDLPNGQKVLVPTLQMTQDMRGALRGMIKRNRQAGNDHIVNTLQPLYDDVTATMKNASPEWWKVNRKWADLELQEKAQELGAAFSNKAGPKFREQLQEFKSLAPDAKDIVRVHFTQQLLDMIENAAKLGGGRNLGELFTKAHTRNMIREVLGDEAAVRMVRMVRDAGVMARSNNMTKGSPTQPRQQMQKEQDADIDMITAAQNLDWRDWRKAAFETMKAAWRERRNKVIGKSLTTPMRDVPAIAENLERMRAARELASRYANPALRPRGEIGLASSIVQSYLDD